MWKKIVDSPDTISYEKSLKSLRIRIEARLENDSKWKVFKHYLGKNGAVHMEEYNAKSREDAGTTVKMLMKKSLTEKEINEVKIGMNRKMNIDVKRCYYEYSTEKWEFTIRPDMDRNLLFIRNDEINELDIIMHIKYKPYEKNILDELKRMLKLVEYETKASIIYYSESSTRNLKPNKTKVIMGKIEIGYDIINNEAEEN